MNVDARDPMTYSPRADDQRRLENAIARRNTTWARYEAANELLRLAECAGRAEEFLVALRKNYNQCQDDWESAVYHLTRERRAFQWTEAELREAYGR